MIVPSPLKTKLKPKPPIPGAIKQKSSAAKTSGPILKTLRTHPLPKIEAVSGYDLRQRYLSETSTQLQKRLRARLAEIAATQTDETQDSVAAAVSLSVYRETLLELAERAPSLRGILTDVQRAYDEQFEQRKSLFSSSDLVKAVDAAVRLEAEIGERQAQKAALLTELREIRKENEQLRARYRTREQLLVTLKALLSGSSEAQQAQQMSIHERMRQMEDLAEESA